MPLEPDEKKAKIATVLFNKGSAALKGNQLDYAIDCYLKCVKLSPDRIEYRQALRAVEYKKFNNSGKGASGAGLRSSGARMSLKISKTRKKWLDVMESAEDILTVNPWDVDAQLEICIACREIGGETAEKIGYWVAQTACASNKERSDAFRMLAFFAEHLQRFNEAINALEQVKKLEPGDAEMPMRIRQLAASSTIKRGHYEEEERPEGEAAAGGGEVEGGKPKPEKTSPVIRPTISQQETPEEKAQNEIQELEAKVAAEPKSAILYVQIGDAYRRLGDIDNAAKTYDRGFKATNDNDLRQRFLEVQIDKAKSREEEGQAVLAKIPPEDKERIATVKKQLEQVVRFRMKAEIDLSKIQVLYKPDDFAAWLDLGINQYKFGLYDEAIKALQRGRGEQRNRWKAAMYLGLCFWQKKNYPLAEKNLKDAVPMVPMRDEESKKQIYYYLGRVAEDAGEKQEAIEHYNEVAAIDYGYLDVAVRLDQLNRGE